MKTSCILAALAAALAAPAFSAPLAFDFKDPKGVNNITFKIDAPLESTSGWTNGISGMVTVDPETLADFSGKILVSTETLHVPNPVMEGHMKGEAWLDAKKYPEISFEVKKVENLKKEGSETAGDVTGILTLHGVSKEITVPAKATYLPGRLKDRVPKTEGDLLVIRASFSIKRSDFGIQAGKNEDKVSDEIAIFLAIAGAASKK